MDICDMLSGEDGDTVAEVLLHLLEEGMFEGDSEISINKLLRDRYLVSHHILFPWASAIVCQDSGVLLTTDELSHEAIAEYAAELYPDDIRFVSISPMVYRRRIYLDTEPDYTGLDYGLRAKAVIANPDMPSVPLDYVVHLVSFDLDEGAPSPIGIPQRDAGTIMQKYGDPQVISEMFKDVAAHELIVPVEKEVTRMANYYAISRLVELITR